MYPKSKCTWCRIVCHYQIFSLIFWLFLGYFGLLTYLCTRDYVHLSSDLQRELSETGNALWIWTKDNHILCII